MLTDILRNISFHPKDMHSVASTDINYFLRAVMHIVGFLGIFFHFLFYFYIFMKINHRNFKEKS